MSFTRQQIAQACQQFGPTLAPLPPSLDGAQLLWALSGNESTFGANATPRHEPAYDAGGLYGDGAVMKPLLAEYGSAAACSYGPWQLMFCNAPAGGAPEGFGDLDTAATWTVYALNKMLAHFKPTTLAQIGEIWNGGHPMEIPPPGVARYVHDLTINYAVPMPSDQ